MAVVAARRRLYRLGILAAVSLVVTYFVLYRLPVDHRGRWQGWGYTKSSYDWASRPQKYPISESDMTHLPTGALHRLPPIQHDFSQDPGDPEREETLSVRRRAVQNTFKKCWASYKEHAWGFDELTPQSLRGVNTFSGWGATLVDSLDTLYIMGMTLDFEEAVREVLTIDWDRSTSSECSLFETNIRYLGGLLAAYDLSGDKALLDKALELGHMLYAGFDTPNHMPVNAFHFGKARASKLVPDTREASASVGTLSLEFTRLSQLTGIPKFYHVIDKIKRELERTQSSTKLPGMWPRHIDLQDDFSTPDNSFTLGGMADSLYEYLPKMYALLGGLDETYGRMHKEAMETVRRNLLFRPVIPDKAADILFSGRATSNGKEVQLMPEVQHLGCFAGGLFALGGRLFDMQDHVEIGNKLARGCAWAYSAFPTGIMPEISEVMSCDAPDLSRCEWDEVRWKKSGNAKLPKGFRSMTDSRYILRPEAAESLFYLYRITGSQDLQDLAWVMFQSIKKATETTFAHSAIANVNVPGVTEKVDSMESFWLAETLKYFYLIFSDPQLISLDEYVFNTEAHPFRLPRPLSTER